MIVRPKIQVLRTRCPRRPRRRSSWSRPGRAPARPRCPRPVTSASGSWRSPVGAAGPVPASTRLPVAHRPQVQRPVRKRDLHATPDLRDPWQSRLDSDRQGPGLFLHVPGQGPLSHPGGPTDRCWLPSVAGCRLRDEGQAETVRWWQLHLYEGERRRGPDLPGGAAGHLQEGALSFPDPCRVGAAHRVRSGMGSRAPAADHAPAVGL